MTSKGLEAIKRLKWGYAITHDERITLCECIEKELKALETIFKYITIGNPFGSVHYIYLNDESEMIMPEDVEILKEVLL